MLRSSLAPIALLALVTACGPAPEPPAAETEPDAAPAPAIVDLAAPDGLEEATAQITEEYIRDVTARLSADELAGRLPGTPGDEMAQQILASEMEKIGLEPGGPDGGWTQGFEMVGVSSDPVETWTFTAGESEVTLDWSDDFIAWSGVQEPKSALEDAEIVFVGYGIEAPEYDWNDYGDVDLTGKVLLMLNNDPDWDPELFEGDRRLYYGRWTYKYEIAAAKGAAGAIVLHTDASAGYGWQVIQSSWTGQQFYLPASEGPALQVAAFTSSEATKELVAAAGHDLDALVESARSRDFTPVSLGISTSLELTNQVAPGVSTANVLGVLPGSDPELADEVVVYTAHFDHLGTGDPDEDGDTIYNGARDNASGCAQILAVARALAALPEAPRRSSMFLFVAAEEQGLLGSKWFARHPTVPAGKLAANVNLDAGNIFGRTEDLVFIGKGKSDLDPIVEAAARAQGRELVGDLFPDKGYFYRSDQFSLAQIGVPAAYVDGGKRLRDAEDPAAGEAMIAAWDADHYHQQSDELTDDWKFDGLVEDAIIGLRVGLHVAQQDAMPSWNPGDEFEAARKEALAAVGD